MATVPAFYHNTLRTYHSQQARSSESHLCFAEIHPRTNNNMYSKASKVLQIWGPSTESCDSGRVFENGIFNRECIEIYL